MLNVVNHFYEFGNFRVDPARRLLLKNGEAVSLTPKAFDTLLVLVASEGRILEKDELMRDVWPGVVVEEVGLAKNISALRKVLGENPDEHRYIVTVPGRGYRFVASVRVVPAEAEGLAGGKGEPDASPEPHPAQHKHRVVRNVMVIGLFVLAASAGLVWRLNGRPALTNQDMVVLADFKNQTGDAVFDGTLKQGLAVQLEQSPFLNIFPDARLQQTLRLMGLPADAPVTPDLARQICQRQGLKALITGSIARLGSHYAISLEAVDAQSGETLARAQVEPESEEQVLKALSQAAAHLRSKLGESLASVQRFDALLEVTTSSLEALRAYSLGYQEARNGKWLEAASFYHRALELDPNFGYAYAELAPLYRNKREPALAMNCAAKAYALRSRVSERERLFITSFYYEYVTGEIDKNIETLKLYRQTYPRDAEGHHRLGFSYEHVGQFENALEEGRIAMQLDPNSANRYATLGDYFLRLNRFPEAAEVYRKSVVQKLDDVAVHHGLFRLAFLNRDEAAMERELKWTADKLNGYVRFEWLADSAAVSGEWRKSIEYARQAIEGATQSDAVEAAAGFAAEAALRTAVMGRCPDVRPLASQALNMQRGVVPVSRSGLAYALCGETAEALRLAGELNTEYPKDTLLNGIWLPAIRAALALGRHDAPVALQSLEPALHYEGDAQFWPQYLRGMTYLQLQQGIEAAGEFRKILDHPGQWAPSVLYSLAHVGLARALEQRHEIGQARKACQEFMASWKRADNDLPRLAEANAECAALN